MAIHLVCRTNVAISKADDIMSRFRWGRIIPIMPEHLLNCDATKHRFYSLGESYGEYNGFLGPPPPKIVAKGKRGGRTIRKTPGDVSLSIGFDRLFRADIVEYLTMLSLGNVVRLALVPATRGLALDAKAFETPNVLTLTPLQAGEAWPLAFDTYSVVQILGAEFTGVSPV